ncbi:putative DNA binding domain-containing protein [Luminiphilus sp.]|nr:putative DNA binding domain-containing protein [Luminiphilus sp.]
MAEHPTHLVQSLMHLIEAGDASVDLLAVGEEPVVPVTDADRRGHLAVRYPSAPDIFGASDRTDGVFFSEEPPNFKSSYDLIFAQTPMHVRGTHPWMFGEKASGGYKSEYSIMVNLASRLKGGGTAFFTVPGIGISNGVAGKKFSEKLETNSLFINGYIELPKDIYKPYAGVNALLLVISRRKTDLHLFSFHDSDVRSIAENVRSLIDVGSVSGHECDGEFVGFESARARLKVERMESIFKGYKSTPLRDLIVSRQAGAKGEEFEQKDNCLFLKLGSGNIRTSTNIADAQSTPSNFQLEIVPEIEAEFLSLFFASDLGQSLVTASQSNVGTVRVGSLSRLLDLPIPIPPKKDRIAMLDTHGALARLSTAIEQISSELVLNPLSGGLNEKIKEMLLIAKAQTDSDVIKATIIRGESKKLEFKQTFQFCVRKKQKEDYVENSALKTLVGFMNTEGGTLLVGVEDSGEILGIETERDKFHKGSDDKFFLRIKDRVEKRIGLDALKNIDMQITKVDQSDVLSIICERSNQETFLDGKDFYIRNTPSTDKLEGRDLTNYIKERFVN